MHKIELLAPAKDLECGISAIKCGADALYIGAPKFGARSSAGNSLEDLDKLITFAHQYYARVYITVNTILNNDEILQAKKLIEQLYNMGADAIIIQDTGLLEVGLPPIPLFASTQMHNHSLEKIQFLEKVGIKRVILARELSLQEIKHISDNTTIELESFIHGALCVSYSGQCYMSYAIGGRSGNRGECAQPCRKKYSLIDSSDNVIAKDLYLLSLKDLNLSDQIEDLLNAGIMSFKIEGRLKDINYIKNIVSFYRRKVDDALDKLDLQKSSSGNSFAGFKPDPYKTFNRGYTKYFLNKRSKDLASPNTPKSIGEHLGIVKSTGKDFVIIDTKKKLSSGDGICFFDSQNQLCGTNINKVEKNKIFPNSMENIVKNKKIFRNEDAAFLKSIKKAKTQRLIAVTMELFNQDNKIILKLIDEDGIEAQESLEISNELAKDKGQLLENIKKQLTKLGDTIFSPVDLTIKLDQYYFIPIKEINELRRKTVERLLKIREEKRQQEQVIIVPNDFPYPIKELDYSANVYNDYAESFYKRHGVSKIEPAAESGINMAGKKLMTTKLCLKYQYGYCSKEKTEMLIEPLYLVDELNKKYDLRFNCNECFMEIWHS